MRIISLTALALVLTGCTTAYWDRPGASLPVLAQESDNCYRASLDTDTPSAFPGSGAGERLLARQQPPPALWNRTPREGGFEKSDEQARYERCMRDRGWRPTRAS